MKWRSITVVSPFFTSFLTFSWILLLISIYSHSIEIFIITLSLILLTVFTRLYMKTSSESILLGNKRKTLKLFQGEQENLSFELSNSSKLPVWNGTLFFTLEHVVSVPEIQLVKYTLSKADYALSFFLQGRSSKVLTMQISAEKRGITRVRGVKITIQDLFGIAANEAKLISPFYTEILVLPELHEVKSIENLSTFQIGSHAYQHALYEDLSAPAGAREYMNSDPFNRIDWKATARTSELKTRVYERSIDMKWVFILDVSDKRLNSPIQISNRIESYISQLAYLCKVAASKDVSFEIHINLEPEGPSPCLNLGMGDGQAQLARALELLARIDESRPLLSFHRMSNWIQKRLTNPAIVIRLGESVQSLEEEVFYELLQKRGHVCYEVKTTESGAFLKRKERR